MKVCCYIWTQSCELKDTDAVLTMLEEYITSMCIGKPQALRDFLLDLVVPRWGRGSKCPYCLVQVKALYYVVLLVKVSWSSTKLVVTEWLGVCYTQSPSTLCCFYQYCTILCLTARQPVVLFQSSLLFVHENKNLFYWLLAISWR